MFYSDNLAILAITMSLPSSRASIPFEEFQRNLKIVVHIALVFGVERYFGPNLVMIALPTYIAACDYIRLDILN